MWPRCDVIIIYVWNYYVSGDKNLYFNILLLDDKSHTIATEVSNANIVYTRSGKYFCYYH